MSPLPRCLIRVSLLALLVLGAMSAGATAQAAEWNVGLKHLTLRDPVGGGAMTGIVTYPTAAAPRRTTVDRFPITAAEDSAPAAGRFPLVVFSHGTGSSPNLYLWLFEGLTAKGFVVAGVAHPKDSSGDRSGSFADGLLVDRPQHVSALIDDLEGDATLGNTIDAARIGITGHSAGGYTAILAVGGVPDFAQLQGEGRCRSNPVPKAIRRVLTHDPARSPVADGRIRAAAPMAPALGCLFDSASLASIHVPIRFYQADQDEILQPGFNAAYYADLFSPAADIVHVANAGHFVFLATCPLIMTLFAREACIDPYGTDRSEVHRRLVDDLAAFFARSLGSPEPRS